VGFALIETVDVSILNLDDVTSDFRQILEKQSRDNLFHALVFLPRR